MAGREDVMRKVQALLDKAASTTFDAERDSLLAKADELMFRHSIEEVELAATARGRNHGPIKPELREVVVPLTTNSDLTNSLYTLFSRLARHVGCKIGGNRYNREVGGYVVKLVGYPADLDYLQMMFLNLQIHFLSRMEPKPDASLSDVENFTMLWESGMGYERIFEVMGWPWETNADGSTKQVTRKILRPMRTAYQEKCKAEGREPVKGLKGGTYSKSFIDGYVHRINARLDEMKAARDEAAKGHEVVLAGRASDLDEAFFEFFPDQRPHPDDCECENCHYYRCRDPKCTRSLCKEMRKPVKYRAPKAAKVDARGYRAGRDVANSADLSGTDGKVGGAGGELK